MALAIEFPQVVWSIEFGGDETVVRQVTMTGGGGAGGGGVTVHNDLTGRSDPDTHPISSITGLSAALAAAGNVDSVNGQTGTVSLDLDDLTDVDTTTDPPDADDVLAWDGATWTPATLTALGAPGLSNATPADLGTAAPGVSTEASRADHVHAMPTAADVGADADGAAQAVADSLGGAAVLDVGTTTGTVAAGDDARLSDARTPTSHNHAASEVTSGTLDIARIPTGTTSTTAALGDHNHSGVYQPADADLTTIAGLTATTDSFIQAKSSAWAARTIAQVKTDLGVNTGIIIAGGMWVAASSATAFASVGSGGTVGITMADSTATNAWANVGPIPWSSIDVYVVWANINAGTGNVTFDVRLYNVNTADNNTGAGALNTSAAYAAAGTVGSGGYFDTSVERSKVINGGTTPSSGDWLSCLVRRLGSDGADTLVGNIRFYGIEIRKAGT